MEPRFQNQTWGTQPFPIFDPGRPLGWLVGYGLFSLAEKLRVVRFDFFTVYIFGREVPDLVGWSAIGELFGIGLGAVTGAAIVWILKNPRGALYGESS